MKSDRIFIGPIYKNGTMEEENEILIQAKNKKYLKLQQTKYLLQRLGLEFSIFQNNNFMDRTSIREEKLRPYISVSTEVNLKKVRKIYQKKESS